MIVAAMSAWAIISRAVGGGGFAESYLVALLAIVAFDIFIELLFVVVSPPIGRAYIAIVVWGRSFLHGS